MLRLDSVFSNTSVLKKSDILLKIRLCFYGTNLVHLTYVAWYLLTIDFSQSSNPIIQQYEFFRWKLITSWFNLLSMAYYPICLYCDWRELNHSATLKHVHTLNNIRYLLFSSIILPTTMFSDVLFWRLWTKDRELIAPFEVDELVPFWTQHSMHTISMVATILDLIMVPRRRPENMKTGISVMSLFLTAYIIVCGHSVMKGEYIYPIFKSFDGFKLIVVSVYSFLGHFFFYFTQWLVVDLIWGHRNKTKKLIW